MTRCQSRHARSQAVCGSLIEIGGCRAKESLAPYGCQCATIDEMAAEGRKSKQTLSSDQEKIWGGGSPAATKTAVCAQEKAARRQRAGDRHSLSQERVCADLYGIPIPRSRVPSRIPMRCGATYRLRLSARRDGPKQFTRQERANAGLLHAGHRPRVLCVGGCLHLRLRPALRGLP